MLTQGVRKEKSPFQGMISSFYRLNLTLVPPKSNSIFKLKDVEFIETLSLEKKYKLSILQHAVSELFQQIYIIENEYAIVYELVLSFFYYLKKAKENQFLIFSRFAFRLLEIIGTPIYLHNHIDEGRKLFIASMTIEEVSPFYHIKEKRNIVNLADSTLDVFKQLYNLHSTIVFKEENKKDIIAILEVFLTYHYHKKFEFKTLKMYPI